MKTSFILLSSFWFLLRTELHVFAQMTPYVLVTTCGTTSSYASNSPFQTNLNTLLRSLYSNGTRDGYFSTTVGASPDTVYGLVHCRGDLSMADCGICINYTIVELTQRCPNSRVAMLRDESCLLRYSNQSFLSQRDDSAWSQSNHQNVGDADLTRYAGQLGNLMDTLSINASSRASRYASGSTDFTDFSDIYGLAQCTRDLTPDDCSLCLRNMINTIPSCCNTSVGARIYTTTCNIRYELYPYIQAPAESPPPPVDDSPPPPVDDSPPPPVDDSPPPPVDDSPPPPPPQPATQEGEGTGQGKSANVIVIVVPSVVGVLLFAICACLITRRIRNKANPQLIYDGDEIRSEEFMQFDLDTIRTATNDFSDANKLGEGGFGAVYKGEILDGQDIAVKRLSNNSGQGSREFKNEVVLIHKLQHRNLVRLLGFCSSGEEKLLIYEYLPNLSLDKYIFDTIKKSYLDWERRYKIAGGIARGLLYLHEDSRLRIIHRDLKAGNILLDEEMNPKIADFGMAKLFVVDQTQGNTSRIAGTFGYMAPEYALQGLFSVKSDVYSFGVLLLEIVSGQKASGIHISSSPRDLLSYAWNLWREGNPLQLMDPILTESFSANEVMKCIHIGLLCVQHNINDRPTMSSVVLMLNSYSLTLQSPTPPSFLSQTMTGGSHINKVVESNDSTSSSLLYSIDGVSLGKTNPR